MKFKKSLLIVCLIIFLFSIASVSANEIDDVAITAEDNGIISVDEDSSVENMDEILTESSQENVIEEEISAKNVNGVLTITLPKKEDSKVEVTELPEPPKEDE